jgi:uncharacterized membrane protein YhaH (DUF805 family)
MRPRRSLRDRIIFLGVRGPDDPANHVGEIVLLVVVGLFLLGSLSAAYGGVAGTVIFSLGLAAFLFRKRISALIKRLPERQQSAVWTVLAVVIVIAFVIGVAVLYSVLGFGHGSSYGQG